MAYRDIEIVWLKTFVEVTSTGSMTVATKNLYRSQSAVSMHIKNIEDILGNKIFYRDARKLTLTPIGQELLLYAKQILAVYNNAMRSLIGSDIHGSISLGIPDDYAVQYLPKVLHAFSEKYPFIEVTLLCEPTSTMIPKVEDNQLDIAIITRDHLPRGQYLFSEELVWVGSKNYPIWTKSPLPVAIYELGSLARKNTLDILNTLPGGYRIVYSSPYVAGQLAAVESGMAITVLARGCVPDSLIILDQIGLPQLPHSDIAVIQSETSKEKQLTQFLLDEITTHLTVSNFQHR